MISAFFHSAKSTFKRPLLLGCLAFLPLLVVGCAEIDEAGDKVYYSVFEKSRQRRIEKDMANLEAGRPLQYHRSRAHLYEAKRTGRD